MRCPYGCREAHRKQYSTQRSVEYYRTDAGKGKKKTQNGKRRRQERNPNSEKESAENISRPEANKGEWNAQMVEHVRVVTSLIEGRRVNLDEILKMLSRILRQPTHTRRRRMDYIVGHLNKASP